ncbi:Hypothetical protein DHA2_153921 [Giardia duodenalis]|uniref:Uncharacterized protein n=1 Tax=Giardia intestinalis TaxID=5741 RepID=V6T8L4_GIAIN|nr:Hypothetical protein DHA2_153921 [Giardia intestinalis]
MRYAEIIKDYAITLPDPVSIIANLFLLHSLAHGIHRADLKILCANFLNSRKAMGISASCNLDDGVLKQSLPRTPVIADPDDPNASLSIPNFAEDESTGEPNENRSSVWATVHSKLPKSGTRFSDLKPVNSGLAKMASSLSAEERQDLEDLQRDVMMEDMDYSIPNSNAAKANTSQPVDSIPEPTPGLVSPPSLVGSSPTRTKASNITALDSHQIAVCLSKNLSSANRKSSLSSDDLNDFNAARFREANL